MTQRLPTVLSLAKPAQYNFAVVLGGTNDLGYGTEPRKIFEGLRTLYTTLQEAGVRRVFAVNVPESAYGKQNPKLSAKREAVNALIAAYAKEHADRMTLIDLAAAIPQPSGSGQSAGEKGQGGKGGQGGQGGRAADKEDEEAEKNWDDGLHFSAQGYDAFGELVFRALQPELDKLVAEKMAEKEAAAAAADKA